MNWLPIDLAEHNRRIQYWGQWETWLMYENVYTPEWHELTGFVFTPNITVEELLDRYAAGERNFIDIRLPEKSDLTGINLAGAILLGADLVGANFTDATLTECDFRHAIVYGTNFTRANLEGANITSCYATGAIFKNASLLNTVGLFGINCGTLYEDTIMRDGSVRSYEGRA
jgi:Pentapeptide repeats (8 copies)